MLAARALQALFKDARPDWKPDYYQAESKPLFILGMPRSGTTLLEQILGAHSNIENSGESRAMGIAFRSIKMQPEKENLTQEKAETVNRLTF